MKKLLPAFLFFISFTILLGACRRGSHAVSSILLLADSLMQSHPDSSLQLLEAIPAPQKMGKTDRAWYALLLTLAKYKNYVSLENDSLIQVAVDYFEKNSDRERLAKSYFYSGCVHREQEDISTAINLYLKSLRTMPQGGDSVFLSMVYGHLGDCYGEQYLNSAAIDAHKNAYALCGTAHIDRALYALLKIGDNYLIKDDSDSAFIYYQQAKLLADSLQTSAFKPLVYKNIAALYNERGEYEEANSYISEAMRDIEVEEGLYSIYFLKGDIMNHLNKKDSALYYWNLAKYSFDIETKASAFDRLFELNKEQSRWREAALCADSFIVYFDSIQASAYRAEIGDLMDNHQLEIHKYALLKEHQLAKKKMIYCFWGLFLVLALIYMWRDRCRKNKYIALQKQLNENRAEIMMLSESSAPIEEKSAELHDLKEKNLQICISLFEATEGYKKLNELKNMKPGKRILKIQDYRERIIGDIRESFLDVMNNLRENCRSLTNEDLFYCLLSLLHCPKDLLLGIMDASSDAIKARKHRIKDKMDTVLFDKVFGSDNQKLM